MKRKPAGFTLLELSIVIGMLLLLVAALSSFLWFTALEYQNDKERLRTEEACRLALSTITNEFRQGTHLTQVQSCVVVPDMTVLDPDPKHFSTELDFTELTSAANATGIADTSDPSNFQFIRYFVSNNHLLMRELYTTLLSGGKVIAGTLITSSAIVDTGVGLFPTLQLKAKPRLDLNGQLLSESSISLEVTTQSVSVQRDQSGNAVPVSIFDLSCLEVNALGQ